MGTKQVKISIVGLIVLVGIITCLHPVYPDEQVLQHVGTILLILIPILDIRFNRLSMNSFVCVSIFIVLHIIGARYIYSCVPYNDWFKSLFHIDLNAMFHTTRNHYDRFVHFFFGVLAFPYLYELTDRNKGLSKVLKVLIVWSFIQSMSMFYEIFEWFLTIIMSSDVANDYNGQQGDIWDAQKDMVLAMFGSTFMSIIYLIKKKKKLRIKNESTDAIQ